MRGLSRPGWRFAFLTMLLPMVLGTGSASASDQAVAAFANEIGLHDVAQFVETVTTLRDTGHLPARYVTKSAARARGWHGGGLCAAWPDHVIGGDAFGNFQRALPARPGRR